jgi:hypothetical protein
MAARKPKPSPRAGASPGPRGAARRSAPIREGQTSAEAGAASLRAEAEREWAAADRRAARKRRNRSKAGE